MILRQLAKVEREGRSKREITQDIESILNRYCRGCEINQGLSTNAKKTYNESMRKCRTLRDVGQGLQELGREMERRMPHCTQRRSC